MSRSRMVATLSALAFALSSVLAACGGEGDPGDQGLSDFVAAAEDADCADDVNRLYRIDGDHVLWHREDLGCADAAYAVTLYGPTPDDELCSSFQTIAGPVTECRDDRVRAEFETIIHHLQDADLGLDEEHTVELVWDAQD